MLIQVTQKHIDAGTKKQCGQCPVALSVIEATGCQEALVAPPFIHLMGQGERYHRRIEAPIAVTNFVRRFDNGDPVKPFEFELSC